MGNLYNVEQHTLPKAAAGPDDATPEGLKQWKCEVRKQVMEKLKGYSPDKVEEIIQKTFGDSY